MHCHDWATAPVAFGDPQAAPVFTIHNLNYGADLIGRAVAASAVATTVSPTYAAEARTLRRFRVRCRVQGPPMQTRRVKTFLSRAVPGLLFPSVRILMLLHGWLVKSALQCRPPRFETAV